MREIVAMDLGGTHARFACVACGPGAQPRPGTVITLAVADHPSLESAWQAFVQRLDRPPPREAALAVAAPVTGDVVRFTNSPWGVRPAAIADVLGMERCLVINDFAAIAHAVGVVALADLMALAGPDDPLPETGAISIVGPGTGLGAALLVRGGGRPDHVQPTEGGHIGFAPVDAIEDALLTHFRTRYGRVSVERLASGPGFGILYQALSEIEGRPAEDLDDQTLWMRALEGGDPQVDGALDRFCAILGGVAGDMALAHGAVGVVIAGGLALRIGARLARSRFAERFCAKGRYQADMARIPVKLMVHPQPGLLGAAAAFVQAFPAEPIR